MEDLQARISRLEYHQKLLLGMANSKGKGFDVLIIKEGLSEEEVRSFFRMCDLLEEELRYEKSKDFVFCTPLMKEFKKKLNPKLDPAETILACLEQNVRPELMMVLHRHLD